MTHRLSIRINGLLALSVTALTLAIAPSLAAADGDYAHWKAAGANSDNNASVFPVQSNPYGLSYNDWSARWWQWAFSLPIDHSSLFGTADCRVGQFGPVWFLPGAVVNGATPRKDCTVDFGTALFVALINAECSNLEGNGATGGQLQNCAESDGKLIDLNSLKATLDNEPLTNLSSYLVGSPLFLFGPLPDNNLITYFCITEGEGCPAAPRGSLGISVGTGVYLMLRPLSVGVHTLEFHAAIPGAFTVDTTYRLIVKP